MRKLFLYIAILALFCFNISSGSEVYLPEAQANMTLVVAGGGTPAEEPNGSEPCDSGTYDFSDGDNESFEAESDGTFCTADWSVTDTDGVIDTSNSGWSFCGSNSLQIVSDSDNTGTNEILANFGAQDADLYFRGYVKIPEINDYDSDLTLTICKYDTGGGELAALVFFGDSGTDVRIYITSGEYHSASEGDEVRFEIHAVANGTSTLRVWRKNGASWDAVETNNGGGDVESEFANTVSGGAQYMLIDANGGSAVETTWYFDDMRADLDGTGYIGAQTCQ